MKAATITQPLASAAPAVDDQILRPLNPRTLTVDIVLPVFNEAHMFEQSVTKLHKYLASNLRIGQYAPISIVLQGGRASRILHAPKERVPLEREGDASVQGFAHD